MYSGGSGNVKDYGSRCRRCITGHGCIRRFFV